MKFFSEVMENNERPVFYLAESEKNCRVQDVKPAKKGKSELIKHMYQSGGLTKDEYQSQCARILKQLQEEEAHQKLLDQIDQLTWYKFEQRIRNGDFEGERLQRVERKLEQLQDELFGISICSSPD